jgi:hypothetical protein
MPRTARIACLDLLAGMPTPPPLCSRPLFRLLRLFEDGLRSCLESKPPPFNVSLINDRMKRQDPRWNVQAELGERSACRTAVQALLQQLLGAAGERRVAAVLLLTLP